MKKKTEKQYAEFIKSTIEEWVPRLHLHHFTIYQEKDSSQKYLACRYNYPYLDGAVLWTDASYKDWADGTDDGHERKIVHELCHLITDPFYTRAGERYVTMAALEDERERLTDHIAVMAYKNYEN